MRADRLLRLLMLLQRHGRATAAWLAEQLEVSERTILRDMEALSAAGVPVYTEQGKGGGCVLLEGFTTDATGLTAAEAQALFAWAGRETAADLGLHHDLSGALAKVAASVPKGSLERAEAAGSVLAADRRRWFSAEADAVAAVLPVLRRAAVEHTRVRIRYRSAGGGKPRTRTLDPIGLVDHSGRWYLVAEHRGEARTYRVDRVSAAAPLAEAARPRDTRHVAEVWRELRGRFESQAPEPVPVVGALRVDTPSETRRALGSQFVSGTGMEPDGVLPDGRQRVRMFFRAPRMAVALLVSFVADIEVLGPPEVLEEVRATVARAHERYG